MKNRSRLQIAFWLAFALILSCGLVTAQPPMPHHFWGIVTVGGLPALDGTVVSAVINGEVASTQTPAPGGESGTYVFKIPGPSGTIEFFIDELKAEETYEFQPGASTELNLSVPAPKFVVSDLSINPTEVHPGEAITIGAKVKNEGLVRFTYEWLRINGSIEATKVTLMGGETASVTFLVTKSVEGTYAVEVDGNTGTFNVIKPTTPPPTPPATPPTAFAEFTLTALTIVPDAVSAGDQVAIIVDVKNVGNAEGTYTLTLWVNGEPVQTRGITLAGGESGVVTFIMFGDIEGTYDVEVDGLTGSFTVVPSLEIPSMRVEIPMITPEAPASFEFENAVISELKISVVRTVENAWVDIRELTERPADVPMAPPGLTYRYLSIAKENIEDNDISSVTITFKVEKTWIDLQEIDENKIKLNRYSVENNEWVSLPTNKVGEDNTHVHYSATSPRLSIFAVTCESLTPASFEMSALEITPKLVSVGEAVTVHVTVTNKGDLEGVYAVSLKVNGAVVATENLALAGKESKPLSFTLSENVEGTYNVEVDGLTGTFVVESTPSTEPLIGLWMTGGIIAAAVIISVGVFYVKRRKYVKRKG